MTAKLTELVMKQICFRQGGLLPDFNARHDPEAHSLGAKRDLSRYYRILEQELKLLELTDAEAALLCDAVDPAAFDEGHFDLLWAHVDDAILKRNAGKKHRVDRTKLVAKLRALTPATALAIVDAVERYWRSPTEGPRKPVLELAGYIPDEDGNVSRIPKG